MTFTHSFDSSGSSNSLPFSQSGSACSLSAPELSVEFSGAADSAVSPVERFVAEMHGFERLLRGVYAAGGRLQVAAVEAQAEENLSPVAGHQVLSAITAAQTAISQALSHSAGGHRLLERLGSSMGYDVRAYGDTSKPPEPVPFLPTPLSNSLDALDVAA